MNICKLNISELTVITHIMYCMICLLQALAEERESIMKTLKRQESVTEQLSQEKEKFSLTEQELKTKLRNIEEETQTILQEKSVAEMR